MPRSLTFKVVAAFLAVSLIGIALVALFGSLAAANEFNRFVSQEATNNFYIFVTDYYTNNNSLHGIDAALRQQFQQSSQNNDERPRLFPSLLAGPDGYVFIGGDGYLPGQTIPPDLLAGGTRIVVNNQVIAVAIPRPTPPPSNRAQQEYFQRTGLALILAVVGAALVAILLGVWLARTITKPVLALTDAARSMAKGDLGQTVRVQSRDEVGELATAFNIMSADLAHADRTRRQMTADIAHELRNPLTVIGGYLDAMRTGDLQPTPARLEAVYDEIQHLEHIVEDLRTLSLADAGALILNRQRIPASDLLQRVAARYAPQVNQKHITLSVHAEPKAILSVDEARMMQVLDNLVSNALKHTPADGSVRLSAETRDQDVRLLVVDNGEGIAPEDLPRVFERFYRSDRARDAEDSSSGLGLAIAQAIVKAHGGTIWAESEPGHGATFTVQIPGAKDPPAASVTPPNPLPTERLAPAT